MSGAVALIAVELGVIALALSLIAGSVFTRGR